MTTNDNTRELLASLVELDLRWVASNLDDLVALATRKRWSIVATLEYIAEHEIPSRRQRSLERRLARSKVGRFKPVADFDWAWPKKIYCKLVDDVLSLEFVESAGNVVLVAAQGLGKTMLAKNITSHRRRRAHRTIRHRIGPPARPRCRGVRARSRSAAPILEFAQAARTRRTRLPLVRRLKCGPPVPGRQPSLRTQEPRADDEPRVQGLADDFPSSACTTALIDRIVHHSDVIVIEGDSYRRREAKKKTRSRRTKTEPSKD